MYGNPMYGNPMYGNPMYGNPMYGNPMYGNSRTIELPKASSARPTDEPDWLDPYANTSSTNQHVVVIDSGLIEPKVPPTGWPTSAVRIDIDQPDLPDTWPGSGSAAGEDHWLDPVAGHGTFIAGIIDTFAPGCEITVIDGFEPTGQCTESDIRNSIKSLLTGKLTVNGKVVALPDIMNLSFGGPILEDANALKSAIADAQQVGVVVVASAGNDGTWRMSYPAAFPGVVSVAAVGRFGPAWFTNYGEWVRACAPGVDVVSSFFTDFNGIGAPLAGRDTDQFRGWAKWNGSSFAAPRVVAALVREMRLSGCSANKAVERIIDADWLARIPGLGTVVNL
jgi:Subtilase family